ncbi:hypothetical protein COD69_02625 [Bacillus thuringiensis]|nr:hypothetical protein COD69_02625 [Bacillus thuringiensis]
MLYRVISYRSRSHAYDKKNNSSRNPDCSLKCDLYLHQNRLKYRWFSLRKELYGVILANLFI